jgi:hypothetical protein
LIIQTEQNPLKGCENLISVGCKGFRKYDVLLFNRNKCMSFQDGMDKEMPVRITSDEDVPDEFFLDNITFFIRDEKNVGLQGEITRAEVQTLVASAYFKYQRQIKDTHFTKRIRNNNILD